MKAKLIKMVEGYTLSLTGNIDDLYGISNQQLAEDYQLYKLSIKNCEAIANGYDLDELVKTTFPSLENCGVYLWMSETDRNRQRSAFIKGFQKALEILGDKKFSLEDMKKVYLNSSKYEWFGDCIKSLQQTEWDVEICCYIGNGDKESDSFKDPIVTNTGIPKLDEDSCLILRIK